MNVEMVLILRVRVVLQLVLRAHHPPFPAL